MSYLHKYENFIYMFNLSVFACDGVTVHNTHQHHTKGKVIGLRILHIYYVHIKQQSNRKTRNKLKVKWKFPTKIMSRQKDLSGNIFSVEYFFREHLYVYKYKGFLL